MVTKETDLLFCPAVLYLRETGFLICEKLPARILYRYTPLGRSFDYLLKVCSLEGRTAEHNVETFLPRRL